MEYASVLEELWYGNIEPSEYDCSPCPEYKTALHLLSRNEEKLLSTLSDEQKALFTRCAESRRELQSITERLLFKNSSRRAARPSRGERGGKVDSPPAPWPVGPFGGALYQYAKLVA